MEVCKIKIAKDLLQMLVDSNAITTNDFQVIGVDENGFDYAENPVYKVAKEKSDKAFRELKKIEFEIRNKIN